MATIAQSDETRLLQIKVTEEAHRRIRLAAAHRDINPGVVVSELATTHLNAKGMAAQPTIASDSKVRN